MSAVLSLRSTHGTFSFHDVNFPQIRNIYKFSKIHNELIKVQLSQKGDLFIRG